MTDLQALLDQIDRLDQEATKGPWAVWPQMDDDGATYPEYLEGPKNDLFGARGWDNKHYIQEIPELTMDDAEFIALARTFTPAASRALRAVLDAHQKTDHQRAYGFPRADKWEHYCTEDNQPWPCPTVQAITDALGADGD